MSTDYQKLIDEYDKLLNLLRKSMIRAQERDKNGWLRMFDTALDERSRLMKIRDGKIDS